MVLEWFERDYTGFLLSGKNDGNGGETNLQTVMFPGEA